MQASLLVLLVLVCGFGIAHASVADCFHQFPTGQYFNLEPLFNANGDYHADDKKGDNYYFNVCGDTNTIPMQCQQLAKAVHSPAYQVTSTQDCFWLGTLKGMEWELIDRQTPAAGVELYYFDGEPCEGGKARDIRIQFFCDPNAGVGNPADYYVVEDSCHYSITWPSVHGCPADGTAAGGSWGWGWITFFIMIAALYLMVGCTYNVTRLGVPYGPEAIPNSEFWRELPSLVKDGIEFTKDKVQALMGKNRQYQQVDGVEYEWG